MAVIARVAVAAGLAMSFLALGQSIDSAIAQGSRQAPLHHCRPGAAGRHAGAANSLWVSTASSAHAAIDRAATAVASRLAAVGYPVTTSKIYALEAQYTASENSILAIVEILGLVVVAIMLMGLASTLTMGIIERTREIGILRCLGARSRHIRRIFTTEAVVLTLAGWALGILLGWLIYQGLLILVRHEADLILPQDFPPASR